MFAFGDLKSFNTEAKNQKFMTKTVAWATVQV